MTRPSWVAVAQIGALIITAAWLLIGAVR